MKPIFSFVLLCLMIIACKTNKDALDTVEPFEVVASFSPGYPGYTDVWEYVDEASGTRYALLGSSAGVSIIDVSQPSQPVEVSLVPIPGFGFDMKVWRHYLYSVSGRSGGDAKITDISDPANPVVVGSFPDAHNIFITEDGYLIAEVRGLKIYDLNADPVNPALLWQNGNEGHDAALIGNRLYDFHGGINPLNRYAKIWDVSDITQPVLLATITDPTISYYHSGWPSKDGNYLYICDELAKAAGADISIWDISDLNNPTRVGQFADENSLVHNIYVIGDYAYVSYYAAGLRIFDVSNPAELKLLWHFDTSEAAINDFVGAFGVYPFRPDGVIYVSDMQNGLFIFKQNR